MVRSIPELEYLQKDWLDVCPYAFGALLVYSMGLVAHIVYGVWKAPQLAGKSPGFLVRYKFAFSHLRPSCWWWCLVETTFSFCLVLVQTMTSDLHLTLFMLAMLVLVTLNRESRVRPYKHANNNHTSVMMKHCLLMCIILLTALVDQPDTSTKEVAITCVLLSTVIPVVVATLFLAKRLLEQCSWETQAMSPELLYLSHNFRNVLVMLLLIPERQFLSRFRNLDEEDDRMIRKVLESLVGVFLGTQPGRRMSQQRVMPGVPFSLWSPQETSMNAVDAIVSKRLQAVQVESSRTHIALLSLIQGLKRGTVCPVWPPAVPRNVRERILLYLGMPITRLMTQEDFVMAFASSSTVSSEDLVRIFEACGSNAESSLPMESILKDFTNKTAAWDSEHLLHMNLSRAQSIRIGSDVDAVDSEQLTPAQNSSQEQNAPSSLIIEMLPCVEDEAIDVNDACCRC